SRHFNFPTALSFASRTVRSIRFPSKLLTPSCDAALQSFLSKVRKPEFGFSSFNLTVAIRCQRSPPPKFGYLQIEKQRNCRNQSALLGRCLRTADQTRRHGAPGRNDRPWRCARPTRQPRRAKAVLAQ